MQIHRLIIFLAITILAIVVCLASWWEFAVMVMVIAGIFILSAFSTWIRSAWGWLGRQICQNNNYPLYVWVVMTLIFFICAFKYGAGEPLFVSAWTETKKIIKGSEYYQENKDEIQTFKNRLFSGLNKTGARLDLEKEYVKNIVEKHGEFPPQERGNATPIVYNQKMRNYLVYGVFVEDAIIQTWFEAMPADFKIKPDIEKSRRTWVFWKLAFMFLFLTTIYLPFAISDEVVEWLEKLKDIVKKKHQEYKAQITLPSVPAPTTGPAPAPGIPRLGILQKLSLVYASDMAAEFTVKLIDSLIKLFSR